jgi:hypothetical protein
MVKNKIKQKEEGGKCYSPVLLLGKITTCRARRPRKIIMWNEGQDKI